MKFLDEINFSENEAGIFIVANLAVGWREAAREIPKETIKKVLNPGVIFANNRLRQLNEHVDIETGHYGLHHIHLIPERAGLDLLPDQNAYISHNLTNGAQVSAVVPILFSWLKCLDDYAESHRA